MLIMFNGSVKGKFVTTFETEHLVPLDFIIFSAFFSSWLKTRIKDTSILR